jgi:excisionase family DNA binding protein
MDKSQERIQFDPNKFYTPQEAANGMSRSYKTVLKWIKSRQLKTSRPAGSRKFLIKGNSIIDFIDSNELLTPILIFKLAAVQMVSHWSPQYVEELAHDPEISELQYQPVTDAELENLQISGKVLNEILWSPANRPS